VILVELDEGIRIPIASSTIRPEELAIGTHVVVGFTKDEDFLYPDVHLASSTPEGER
jgi:hypothetical protein